MRLLRQTGTPLLSFARSLRFFKSKTEKTLNVSSTIPAQSQPDEIAADRTPSIIAPRVLARVQPFMTPRQVWVENFNTADTNRLGIVDLHPEVFGVRARIDLIHENVVWQLKYRKMNFTYMPTKHEIRRSTRKPWPQKGTGRARHGTRRSPIFMGGVKIHGPRGPISYFYMLPHSKRVGGLCSTLSVKLAQNDLHVIDNLDIPTNDPQYLLDLIKTRKWGPSVLIIDVDDILPENIAVAANSIPHVTLMPVYGLNVYSMLKYHTLVLTLAAVEKIEQKLLQHLYAPGKQNKKLFVSSV